MRIECLTTFLDGRERFEKGDIFTIDDAKAEYFIANKWAKEVGAPAPAGEPVPSTDLTIDNSVMGTGDSNG